MKRYEMSWMIFAQAVHLGSMLSWLSIMEYIQQALDGPSRGIKLGWPTFVTGLALLYPLLLLLGSGAAWWSYAKRQNNLALVFISVPLFLSLPFAVYGFVVRLAVR